MGVRKGDFLLRNTNNVEFKRSGHPEYVKKVGHKVPKVDLFACPPTESWKVYLQLRGMEILIQSIQILGIVGFCELILKVSRNRTKHP